MINDEIAEKICIAILRHTHVLCTQPTKREADVDGMEFHRWLDSHGVIHELRRTSHGTNVSMDGFGSVLFAPNGDPSASLGRKTFDATEYR
jgi:hypothetical protein